MIRKYWMIIFVVLITGISCINVDDVELNLTELEKSNIPSEFDYKTVNEITIQITAPDNLASAVFNLANAVEGKDSTIFAKGTFDQMGKYHSVIAIPTYVDTIQLISEYIGLVSDLKIPIVNNEASINLSEINTKSAFIEVTDDITDATTLSQQLADFNYLAEYNRYGTPENIEESDLLDLSFYNDLNSSLPEGKEVPSSYFEDNESKIQLIKDAEVWVTFVYEGTKSENAIGYYSYPSNNPPESADEIESLNIIFPNLSMYGSKGQLSSGDKISLGKFSEGTTIGWFLVSDGWSGNRVKIKKDGIQYSTANYNGEKEDELKNHVVALFDSERSLIVFGFEETPRDDKKCDHDFNDAVIFSTIVPFDAVLKKGEVQIAKANDADGDGVLDEIDEFPNDANKAFNNYAPAKDLMGSVAFEDLWPSQGDYDFNDLVVDYNFNLISNSQNLVHLIEANFIIKNIGGALHNGFAFSVPIDADQIVRIENQVRNSDYTSYRENGTEADVDETVIIVAEDTKLLKGDTIRLQIYLKNNINTADLGSIPYNPFLIVNGEREREIHLPDFKPTSKATGYLGTKDDRSNPTIERYYKNNRNLPWAINIYKEFKVPKEKVSIDKQYSRFINWANSGGKNDKDWYLKSD